MVGMVAAQSIGEPITQMTEHFPLCGVSSKSTVTRGVPRIEEILSLSENPKNPSVTIYLNDEDSVKTEKAQEFKYNLEYTCLKDITKSVSICYDPKQKETLLEEDKLLLEQFYEFENMLQGCGLKKNKDQVTSILSGLFDLKCLKMLCWIKIFPWMMLTLQLKVCLTECNMKTQSVFSTISMIII